MVLSERFYKYRRSVMNRSNKMPNVDKSSTGRYKYWSFADGFVENLLLTRFSPFVAVKGRKALILEHCDSRLVMAR